MAEAQNGEHVRGEKIPTYLAAIGGLNAGLWGLAIAVSFPVLTFFSAVGVAAASAFSEGARQKLKKIGDQLKNFAHDLKSHLKEDYHRVTDWFGNRRERKTAEKAASIERAAAAFRATPQLSPQLQFNNTAVQPANTNVATPAVGVTPAAPAAEVVEAPKTPVAPPKIPTP